MRDGFVSVCAVAPSVRVADVAHNVDACADAARVASECGAKVIGLYYFVDAPYGSVGAVNWKSAAAGGLTYRSDDDCVSTVRHQAFRMGVTDIAYLGLLKRLAAKGDTEILKEARRFLQEAPKKAMREAHDSTCADSLREKIVELIIKLQNIK